MSSVKGEEEEVRQFVVKFIKQKAAKGDILAVPANYDNKTGEFEPPDPPPSCEPSSLEEYPDEEPLQGDEDLKQALLQYKGLDLSPRLDIDVKNCSWKRLFDQMNEANVKHRERVEGLKGYLINFWRKMGKSADDAMPWLELIPSDSYLSTLKAGLAVCLLLAKKSAEKEEKIFSAFEEIPFIVIRAQLMRKRFPEEGHLKTRCIKLYETLLGAIADLIGFLLPKKESKKIPFFFNKRASTAHIDETLAQVKGEANELRRLTETIWEGLFLGLKEKAEHTQKRVDKIQGITDATHRLALVNQSQSEEIKNEAAGGHKAALKTSVQVTGVQLTMNNVDQRTEKTGITVEETYGEVRDLKSKLKSFIEKQAEDNRARQNAAREAAHAEGRSVMNAFIPFLEDRFRQAQEEGFRQGFEVGQSRTLEARSQAMISKDLFAKFLGVPPQQPALDFECVLRQAKDFSTISMAQAHSLLCTEQFRHWSQPQYPGLLIVDGNIESSGSERLSAMSFLCASLVASLGQVKEDAITLHFFCGLHTQMGDELRGPNGVIRSLVWQMLMELATRGILSLEFINTRSLRDAIQQRNLRDLCYVFGMLVGQLRLDIPVYCIIDGIDWYELFEWRADLEFFVHELQKLVKDQKLHAVFKLLMASSYQNRYIGQSLSISSMQCVFLQPEVFDGGIISERIMAEATQQFRFEEALYSTARDRWDMSDDDDLPENYT